MNFKELLQVVNKDSVRTTTWSDFPQSVSVRNPKEIQQNAEKKFERTTAFPDFHKQKCLQDTEKSFLD